ncbi:MAG: histidinol-phosphate transaminase [Firmicutes bacterium]|nr:histidinol-phosphate transaminase [Bacillota bacterium]
MSIETRREILAIKPYIPGKPIEEVQKEYGLSKVIKLASNENPLGASAKAMEAISNHFSKLSIYPDGNCTELKAELAKNLKIDHDQIIIGNGSDEVLKLIGEAYLTSDDQVIMADPTFSEYQYVARLMGAAEELVPLKDHKHNLKEMLQRITPQTKIIFICNPNNPTGTIVNQDRLVEFLKAVPSNILVVIDEAYYEYVQASDYPQTISLLKDFENIIITRTFSKVHGLASLRVGYGIAHPKIIANLNRVKEPFNVNSLAQVAAIASLRDQEHLAKSVTVNEQGKLYLYQELEKLGLEYIPTEANFIMFNVRRDANTLFEELLKKGIIIRSGSIFNMPSYIRLTIGTMEENESFIRALKEVLVGENSN